MSRRSIIRGIWGDISKNGIRNGKLSNDIKIIKENKYQHDFVNYVFGKENEKYLTDMGFNCVLVDDDPVKYDMENCLYRHKLDILKFAMCDFDEIVFLDWDCRPVKQVDDAFWNELNKKDIFQANLFQYRTKKCLWRKIDWRKVCNGGFLYLRDNNIPDEFIECYDRLYAKAEEIRESREKQGKKIRFREKCLAFDDEPSFSLWVDEYSNGWQGLYHYWHHFEPECCNLKKKYAFSSELIDNKNIYFVHWGDAK